MMLQSSRLHTIICCIIVIISTPCFSYIPQRIVHVHTFQSITSTSTRRHSNSSSPPRVHHLPIPNLNQSRNNLRWLYLSSSSSTIESFDDQLVLPSSLTIILPAYNEEKRIEPTIEKYSLYLNHLEEKIVSYTSGSSTIGKGRGGGDVDVFNTLIKCNILVVDDGSTDETCQVVQRTIISNRNSKNKNNVTISCLSLERNQGKGSAISHGIQQVMRLQSLQNEKFIEEEEHPSTTTTNYSNLHNHSSLYDHKSNSNLILIADADGSGDIESLPKMIVRLWQLVRCRWTKPGIIVGNRGYEGTSLSRMITRWGFRTCVKVLLGSVGSGRSSNNDNANGNTNCFNVNDTQCGFKLMTSNAACMVYKDLHLQRWTNDVEALYRAKILKIPVEEVIIGWEDKDGSKLASSVLETIYISLVMLMEILYMRMMYFLGRWSI